MKSKIIILHDWKTGDKIEIKYQEIRIEGSCGRILKELPAQSGSDIWWIDENGTNQHAFVKESFEEIKQLMDKY